MGLLIDNNLHRLILVINRIIADELIYAYEELKKTKEFENILAK